MKLAATERALAPTREATVESVPVDSGVAEQSTGHVETCRGARLRAERALPGDGLGVGIEGGVADRIAAGEELGPVMDDVLGQEDVAHDQGAAGVLTGGSLDRKGALASTVAGALGPFVTDHYRHARER